MKKEKTSIVIAFLFCSFMYPVIFKFSSALSYAYVYGIPFVYLLLNYKLFNRLTKMQSNLIICTIMLVFFSFLYPIIHGTGDFSYVKISTFIFRKLVVYIFLISLLVKKYKERANIECFMYYYALTHAIYVIGTLLLVFIPSLKTFWFSVFEEVVSSEMLSESFGYTFRIGWQGFSGYRLTLHCTLSCIFLLYLFYVGKRNFQINKKILLICYILCFLGNMFYGRSGLVLTIITSVVASFVWGKMGIAKLVKFSFFVYIFIVCISCLQDVHIFSEWYDWMSQPILNFLTTGNFGNASLERTHEMVFMPEWNTILFGDGYFVYDGSYYKNTDSGIIRNILFWGIVGWILSYVTTLYSIVSVKRKDKFLCLLILFVFAAFEYKGDVYYEFIVLFLSASFVDSIVGRLYADRNANLEVK